MEAIRTKLKKYAGLIWQLAEEKAALETILDATSRESVMKKLEISRKPRELDELRNTVELLPPETLQAVKKAAPYKGRER